MPKQVTGRLNAEIVRHWKANTNSPQTMERLHVFSRYCCLFFDIQSAKCTAKTVLCQLIATSNTNWFCGHACARFIFWRTYFLDIAWTQRSNRPKEKWINRKISSWKIREQTLLRFFLCSRSQIAKRLIETQTNFCDAIIHSDCVVQAISCVGANIIYCLKWKQQKNACVRIFNVLAQSFYYYYNFEWFKCTGCSRSARARLNSIDFFLLIQFILIN